MKPSPQVTLIEVGPRDGFQAESKLIPAELKVEIIEALVRAGIRAVQVTSFVHPEQMPQMADAEEVCHRIQKEPGVVYSALALNCKGVERARQAGIDSVDLSISASDIHGRKNAGMSLEMGIGHAREMAALARRSDMRVRAGLQCVFGCVYEGEIPQERVLGLIETFLKEGVDAISLADSTGMATPRCVRGLLAQVLPLTGRVPLVLHLHDTRGIGLVNLMAALESGVTSFDTAFGGMGGCPFITGAAGNIATEDTAYLLESLGISTGVDIEAVVGCSRRIEEFLGKRFPGKMHQVLSSSRN